MILVDLQHERNSIFCSIGINLYWKGNGIMLSADQTATEIKRIINDDPTIEEARHIVVTASKRGFFKKKESIHLDGSVRSDVDRRKAEDIARQYCGARELINKIHVIQ